MSRLPEFDAEFGVAPTQDPLSYPGIPPKDSTLLLGNAVLKLDERSRRRLQQWRVVLDEYPMPGEERSADQLPLSHVLLRHNQTPMSGRVPVIAVGSNASPAQMWGKFTRERVSPVLPMVLAAEVRGLAVGVSAHISKPGYLPTTAVLDPASVCRLFVLWPDRAQLAAIDATEPNYHRVALTEPDVTVVLPSGENLSHCFAYVSRHGHLTGDDGAPLTIPDAVRIRSAGNTQRALLESVFGRDPVLAEMLGTDAVGLAARLARDAAGRDAVRRLFAERGWTRETPRLAELIAAAGGGEHVIARPPVVGYDDRMPLHRVPPGAFRVLPSADDFDRRGQAVVRVAPAVAERLATRHVLVSLTPIGDVDAGIRALGALVGADAVEGAAAEVDQVLRNSIGAEVGEDVTLTPVNVARHTWGDLLFGRPNYVTCRVQAADLTTVEREVCLLDELTLGLLGVQTGDEVVIEGWANDDAAVSEVRIKAFRSTEALRARRESLHGGDLSGRFPSSLDALAVSPDLPWIFLDSATRTALGLRGQKLATVRLRASRRFQLRKELREMLLLIGVAFFGLVAVFKDPAWQLIILGGLLVFVAGVVTTRMRGRLVQEIRRPRNRQV